MIKVISIFGTRPEAIKMAPLVKKLEKRKEIESIVVVTAQHRQMLDSVLDTFKIKPNYDLNIMKQGQTLGEITTRALTGLEEVIQKEKPISNFASALGSIYNFHTNSNLQFYYSKHYGGNYTPKKGDYIYFNWGNNWNKNIYNGMFIANSHIGIVEYTSNGVVHTIEGNSGNDTVIKGSYQLTNPSIMGYGSWYK